MSEPMEHIERALPPWREAHRLTECGKEQGSRKLLTRDEFAEKVRVQGKQRAGLSTCMTCWQTAARRSFYSDGAIEVVDWAHNPAAVIAREIQRVDADYFPPAKEPLINVELHAIAALVEAHREEFASYLSGVAETADIRTARVERARKRRRIDHAGLITDA